MHFASIVLIRRVTSGHNYALSCSVGQIAVLGKNSFACSALSRVSSVHVALHDVVLQNFPGWLGLLVKDLLQCLNVLYLAVSRYN